jgi:hypothetical protein
MATNDDGGSNRPLLTARTALVFLFAVLTGIGAAMLMVFAGRTGSEAVLIGVGAMAAGTKFFDWLIH